MPYSNRSFGRRSGTVTVIEEPVRRSSVRTAKIVFWVVWVVTGLLTAVVAASYWHSILALAAGLFAGLVVALLVAGFIVIWPVLRAIWWWATEIVTALLLVWGWVQLAEHTTLVWRITVLVLIIGPLAAIGPVRRQIIAVAWCVIVRHRLRTCFSEFIITNRTGSLPLILWARPTAVGVRVWIWLRPGLALEDIQTRLDLIAVACWSTSATTEATNGPNSALIRLDIKRRNALARNLGSPLASVAAPAPRDTTTRDTVPVPGALDLPDVSAADIAPAKATRADSKAPATVPVIRTVPAATTNGDIEDWI